MSLPRVIQWAGNVDTVLYLWSSALPWRLITNPENISDYGHVGYVQWITGRPFQAINCTF